MKLILVELRLCRLKRLNIGKSRPPPDQSVHRQKSPEHQCGGQGHRRDTARPPQHQQPGQRKVHPHPQQGKFQKRHHRKARARRQRRGCVSVPQRPVKEPQRAQREGGKQDVRAGGGEEHHRRAAHVQHQPRQRRACAETTPQPAVQRHRRQRARRSRGQRQRQRSPARHIRHEPQQRHRPRRMHLRVHGKVGPHVKIPLKERLDGAGLADVTDVLVGLAVVRPRDALHAAAHHRRGAGEEKEKQRRAQREPPGLGSVPPVPRRHAAKISSVQQMDQAQRQQQGRKAKGELRPGIPQPPPRRKATQRKITPRRRKGQHRRRRSRRNAAQPGGGAAVPRPVRPHHGQCRRQRQRRQRRSHGGKCGKVQRVKGRGMGVYAFHPHQPQQGHPPIPAAQRRRAAPKEACSGAFAVRE